MHFSKAKTVLSIKTEMCFNQSLKPDATHPLFSHLSHMHTTAVLLYMTKCKIHDALFFAAEVHFG